MARRNPEFSPQQAPIEDEDTQVIERSRSIRSNVQKTFDEPDPGPAYGAGLDNLEFGQLPSADIEHTAVLPTSELAADKTGAVKLERGPKFLADSGPIGVGDTKSQIANPAELRFTPARTHEQNVIDDAKNNIALIQSELGKNYLSPGQREVYQHVVNQEAQKISRLLNKIKPKDRGLTSADFEQQTMSGELPNNPLIKKNRDMSPAELSAWENRTKKRSIIYSATDKAEVEADEKRRKATNVEQRRQNAELKTTLGDNAAWFQRDNTEIFKPKEAVKADKPLGFFGKLRKIFTNN